jgi:hypothetical protein
MSVSSTSCLGKTSSALWSHESSPNKVSSREDETVGIIFALSKLNVVPLQGEQFSQAHPGTEGREEERIPMRPLRLCRIEKCRRFSLSQEFRLTPPRTRQEELSESGGRIARKNFIFDAVTQNCPERGHKGKILDTVTLHR